MSDLAAALMVAIRVHAGQVDKRGEPYLLHVLRVVGAVGDEAKVVAALHDVLEDGGDKGKRLLLGLDLMGYEGRVLVLLTRDPHQSYADYIGRIADESASTWTDQNAILLAREVKIADLRDNLGRIPAEPADDCRRCEGSGTLNPGLSGCAYCSSTGYGPERVRWLKNWASLMDRYERALATLEGSQG